MIYRELGKTGLKVSAIGFGGIPIQRVKMEEAVSIIHRSEELGINFIDTARGYGISEEFIGEALQGRRHKWIIATKSMARTKEAMLKDIDISLKNLQTDYIDIYQIHNIKDVETFKQVIVEGGAYDALIEAKKQGKIKHIGVTAHGIDALADAVESELFETIMYPYSIVETQANDIFKRAKELGIGVIAMKPMAGGSISDGSLAMRFILENEDVTTIIPGMASIKEVEENALAANDFKPLNDEEIAQCKEIAQNLGETFCRRCGYCAPCPQGIDIPTNLVLKLYFDNYDLKDWAVSRYASMQSNAKDCVRCGICEKRCPYDLPIISMLGDISKSFKV